jgi:apolipoprotein N-acyltransferase
MFGARINHFHRYSFAGLAGLAMGLAYPKFDLFWAMWFAPGFLLLLSLGQSGGTASRIGYIAGLAQFLVGFYWLLLIPKPVAAIAAWLSVSLLMALYIAAWVWICCRCFPRSRPCGKPISDSSEMAVQLLSVPWQRRALWAFTCAAVWVAMEMGIARLLNGFPYSLGLSQSRLLPLIQIASITGVYGVSFIVVWTSAALACAFILVRSTRPAFPVLARELAAPGLALAAVLLFGSFKLSTQELPASRLRVALIQPGIPQTIIWDSNERTNRLQKLVELSNLAMGQGADLLVWPEAALPENMVGRNRETQELITSLVRSNHVWMVFGGIDTSLRRGAGNARETLRLNAAFFIDPAGELMARYFKRRLVMFGEYMPGARWLPFLKHLGPRGGGLEPGRKTVHFQMAGPTVRIAPLICFEDVFPHVTREAVDADTDFLLNLTNNGWFGTSAAQWQHAVAALFRAVENGVPLVRCTNNGLTCWIDSRGRLHDVYFPASRDIYQAGYKIVDVPLRPKSADGGRTIYNRAGDAFGWACVAFTAIALLKGRVFPWFGSERLLTPRRKGSGKPPLHPG